MIRVLKEHIANVKELRDKFYEDLISEKDGQKIQWGAAEIMFFVIGLLFLGYAIFFTVFRSEQVINIVIFYWISVGMFSLMVMLCVTHYYKGKDIDPYIRKYKYNLLFGFVVFANLPLVIAGCFISRTLNEKEIDLDTYMIPFQMLPVDYFFIMFSLNLIKAYATEVDEFLVNHSATFEGWDLYAVFVLIIFAIVLLIMYGVNYFIYRRLSKLKEKRIKARSNEILDQDIDNEEKNSNLVSDSVQKSNKEAKIIDKEFQHGWDYIKMTMLKFQLFVLIFIFIMVALFPGKVFQVDPKGMIDEQLKSSYLNAVTLVTLIMLYFDKHNAWDEKLRMNKETNTDDAKKDDDKKNNCVVH